MQIVIKNLSSMADKERDAFTKAVFRLNQIINSQEFYERVMQSSFSETKGLSNQQIYDRYLSGDQGAAGDNAKEIDIYVVLYLARFSRVVGYTYLDSLRIWVNRKFANLNSHKSIASNLAHEIAHQYGFTHNGNWQTSVPYTLNRIVEALWEARLTPTGAHFENEAKLYAV